MLDESLGSRYVAAHSVLGGDHWLIYLSRILDSAVIIFGIAASVSAYRATWDDKYGTAALLAALLFYLFAEVSGFYRASRGETLQRRFFQIAFLWAVVFFILLLLAYALKVTSGYSRVTVGVWLVATPFLLSAWRVVARRVFRSFADRRSFKRNAVVWGAGEIGEQVARTIEQSPWTALRLAGYVQDEDAACESRDGGQRMSLAALEKIEHLVARARRGDFDILYIALPATARTRISELIDRLADTTISVYMVPDFFTTSLFHGRWTSLEGIPLISVYDTPFWGADGWLKRAEDLVLASLILLLVAVPMLLTAVAVKLSSPGPMLFKQRRYGMDGKEISVWKFRTMTVCEDGPSVPQAKRGDPRVTKLGAFLRRTSLDELPQFINVLTGDMSVVGPRPHAVTHNELYRSQIKGYMLRHKVRPGITGWAQINGWRGETDTLEKMAKRIEHDLWYIRNWSLGLDLKIVILSSARGFTGAGAY